jgi:hypothetical protein
MEGGEPTLLHFDAKQTGDLRKLHSLLRPMPTMESLLVELEAVALRAPLGRDFLKDFRWARKRMNEAWSGLDAAGAEQGRVRQELSMITLNRLIFLSFVQERGWLDKRPQFLSEVFAQALQRGQNLYREVLCPLFFGVLNTPPEQREAYAQSWGQIPFLNGGLFASSHWEKCFPERGLDNRVLLEVVQRLFERYEFSPNETAELPGNRRCVDPVILGRVFEALMEQDQRSQSGSFYTPRHVVQRMVQEAFGALFLDLCQQCSATSGQELDSAIERLCVEHDASGLSPELACSLDRRLASIRILDPAAGSGAFVLGAFDALVSIRMALSERFGVPHALHELARHVATHNLYGVDLLPEAIRLCELRLWLALSMGEPQQAIKEIEALPNLDLCLRQGDALVEVQDTALSDDELDSLRSEMIVLKSAYACSSGAEKAQLASRISGCERAMFVRRSALLLEKLEAQLEAFDSLAASPSLLSQPRGLRAPELELCAQLRAQHKLLSETLEQARRCERLPEFNFALHFPEVSCAGGFDLLIGNPPWVRPHHLSVTTKRAMRQRFRVCYRSAWRPGAGLGGGLAAGQVDMAAVFAERSWQLLRPGGVSALLLPSKLFTALGAGAFRRECLRMSRPLLIVDWSRQRLFGASTYPAFLLSRRQSEELRGQETVLRVERHGTEAESFHLPRRRISLVSGDTASPWLLLAPDAEGRRHPFSHHQHLLGQRFELRRGVLTGCNELFVPSAVLPEGSLCRLRLANGEEPVVESAMLYPLLRGCDVAPYQAGVQRSLLMTHRRDGEVLPALPRETAAFLSRHLETLQGRADYRQRMPPWTLFRVHAALFGPKVLWRDIAKRVEAVYLPSQPQEKPAIALNSLYYCSVRSDAEGYLLSAYLNSSFVRQRCEALAEPAQGGHFRFFSWVMGLLPWPFEDVPKAYRDEICALSQSLHQGQTPEPQRRSSLRRVDELVLEALDACARRWGTEGILRSPA